MATYVSTIKFTDQGIKAVGETTKRAKGVKSAAKKMGIKVKEIYWTLGAVDGFLIFDAPDEETATAWLLQLGSQGYVQTTTGRAFTSAEMDQVLAKMSGE